MVLLQCLFKWQNLSFKTTESFIFAIGGIVASRDVTAGNLYSQSAIMSNGSLKQLLTAASLYKQTSPPLLEGLLKAPGKKKVGML